MIALLSAMSLSGLLLLLAVVSLVIAVVTFLYWVGAAVFLIPWAYWYERKLKQKYGGQSSRITVSGGELFKDELKGK